MSQFSAKEPSLGYHYQIRYALYLLLLSKDKEDHFVKLENLDDVEIGDFNRIELHQTKFHNKKSANLTDGSTDLWKTIRVWSERAIKKRIDLDKVLLVLITTAEASETSILYKLTENNRDFNIINEAVIRFNEITKTSNSGKKAKSGGLQSSFEAYNKLTDEQKQKLVKSIHIRDKAQDLEGIKKFIKTELQLTFLPNQLDSAYRELEGWWYEQCIQHLQGKLESISYNDVRAYIAHINDKYKSDNLPIDTNISNAEVNDTDFVERNFVKQLQYIGLGNHVIQQAKRDFYRASEQRSKWIRENLLNPQEEIDYEFKLKDDWKGKFAFLQDDIEGIEEEPKREKCKHFYTSYYGISYPSIFIRARVTDVFLVKGSCQMLADKQDIAWHPNYIKKS